MDVILISDVANLGHAGEIVKVKEGYARNFLIPEGLAYLATEGNKRRVEAEAGRRATNAAAAQGTAEETAAKLKGITLSFSAKAGDGDRLFGSITAADVAGKLAEAGHRVDKRSIEMSEPIRSVGVHQVGVRLHASVRAEVSVKVVKA